MSRSAMVSLLAAALLAAPAGAAARNMDGRFGIGLEQSLGGASGLALRYFTSETICLAATLGVDIAVVDKGDENDVSAGVVGSAGVAFQLARGQHAHFSVGLRLAIGYRSLDALRLLDPEATASDVHVALELPLGLEVWLADNFSVGVATGVLVNFVPDGGAQLDGDGAGTNAPAGSIGIGIGAGSVTATLSALYYF
ncbi:MAG: hypothetical protein IT385_10110 [Deltaproteobacteria bacterium]|nr:hypothetical protein [Deltaproteobacteria bacterium]